MFMGTHLVVVGVGQAGQYALDGPLLSCKQQVLCPVLRAAPAS
jgi:hypothetical protein